MDKLTGRVQIFFDGTFWVGVFEEIDSKKMRACKVTFGEEPTDSEIHEFILNHYYDLQFSPSVASEQGYSKRINPKRLQREVKKEVAKISIGTKSQQALKLQQEQGKAAKRNRSREQREIEKQIQFELKQQKRKKKHKGR